MKTKNNVQKTALRAAAIIAIFILSVYSQATAAGNKNKTINETAMSIQAATDEKLVIENWMTSESSFSAKNLLEPAIDEPMKVEAWMTSDKLFAAATSALAPAVESKMELEDWMLDESKFAPKQAFTDKEGNEKKIEMWKVNDTSYGNRKFILTQVKDEKMAVENWMLDRRNW